MAVTIVIALMCTNLNVNTSRLTHMIYVLEKSSNYRLLNVYT